MRGQSLALNGTLLEEYNGWLIFDTPCYPNRYKIIHKDYAFDNAGWRYLPTIEDAKRRIDQMSRRILAATKVETP
jgi:hypothetical protein